MEEFTIKRTKYLVTLKFKIFTISDLDFFFLTPSLESVLEKLQKIEGIKDLKKYNMKTCESSRQTENISEGIKRNGAAGSICLWLKESRHISERLCWRCIMFYFFSLHRHRPLLPDSSPQWRRKWQPTPVFLPRESSRQRSLVGCCPWSHTELGKTEEP